MEESKVKKNKFIELLAKKTGMNRKEAEKNYNCTFELLIDAVMEDKSHNVSGFGSFVVTQRAERKGVNLQTGKAMTIPAKKVLKFKVSKSLKEKIAKL